jgi:hypothetical protein
VISEYASRAIMRKSGSTEGSSEETIGGDGNYISREEISVIFSA